MSYTQNDADNFIRRLHSIHESGRCMGGRRLTSVHGWTYETPHSEACQELVNEDAEQRRNGILETRR